MSDICGKCKSETFGGGSWSPDRCLKCGAICCTVGGDTWYYDKYSYGIALEYKKRKEPSDKIRIH